jgi:hypothetical protein
MFVRALLRTPARSTLGRKTTGRNPCPNRKRELVPTPAALTLSPVTQTLFLTRVF